MTSDNETWREQVRLQTKYANANPIARRLTSGFLATLCELVEPVFAETPAARVLEAGCGEGINLARFEQMPSAADVELLGFDIDEPSLENARRLVERSTIARASIYDIPHDDASFDLVVCTEVLEHLEEPERALAELRRVARRWLVTSVPREPLWRVLNMARGKYWSDWGNTPDHRNHWSRRGFVRFIGSAFDIDTVRSPIPWTMLRARVR
jgi:2-polyprenyl-3-methyl-5-hydroxy-6-metoxy-1,4-benzoquinol methylase